MVRVHVNTASLQERNPAIIIVDPYGKYTQQHSRVELSCSCCQRMIAAIDQQGDSAHLIIEEIDSITKAE